MKKISSLAVTFILLFFTSSSFAQKTNDELLTRKQQGINTAVPFLSIAPDSRSGGMGEVGVATSTDAWSMHWNPAKYAFAEEELSVGLAYTPWLRNLGVTDVNLAYLAGYYRLDDQQTIALAIRFFGLGTIEYYSVNGDYEGQGDPTEFTINGAYARKLSDNFSLGIAARYVYSHLLDGYAGGGDGEKTKPGQTAAVDVSALYKNSLKSYPVDYSVGINISNIGAKIGYSDSDKKEFIPTNLRLGFGGDYHIDDFNTIGAYLDFNKLLVPTPSATIDGVEYGEDDDVPVMTGIFRSFSDAPAGFTEELHEIRTNVGAEYWYDKQFAVRAGYQYQHATKGNLKYYTVGLGLRMNVFGLDFAYLIPVDGNNSALANTMRFSLTFDFEGLKDEQKDVETL